MDFDFGRFWEANLRRWTERFEDEKTLGLERRSAVEEEEGEGEVL